MKFTICKYYFVANKSEKSYFVFFIYSFWYFLKTCFWWETAFLVVVPNSISELSNLLCLMTLPIGREIMEESITRFWIFEVFFEEKKFLMFLVEKVIF